VGVCSHIYHVQPQMRQEHEAAHALAKQFSAATSYSQICRSVSCISLATLFHHLSLNDNDNYTSSYTMIQSDSQESVQLVDVGVWEMRGKVKPSAPGGPPEEPAELGEELSRSPALSGTSDGRWFASPTSVDTFGNPDLCPSLPDRCRCHCVKVL